MLNRSSYHALQNGQGAVSSIQLLVWSMVRSNLGQTWSNLVKALQTLGNVSRTIFRGFLGTVGPSRVGNGSVKPWLNFGQPRSNLVKPREMCPGPSLWEYLMWRGFVGSCWLGSGCLVLRVDTRENPVGKNGVMINMVRCDLVQKFKPKTCFLGWTKLHSGTLLPPIVPSSPFGQENW